MNNDEEKYRIVEELYTGGLMDELVKKICRKIDANTDDLKQDLYLSLLEYDSDKIVEMYNNKQIRFFLVRMICNQFNSVNSPFYMKYRRFSMGSYNLDEWLRGLEEEYNAEIVEE